METVVIIGAGPAGLSAGYRLSKSGYKVVLVEADDIIGGLSKTVEFDSNYFELGPHRLFTKNNEILQLMEEILPLQGHPSKDDIMLNRSTHLQTGTSNPEKEDVSMLIRQRFSRIYYEDKFFDYPVKMNLRTILNMGIFKTFLAGMSYIKSMMFKRKENNLEDFMINKFGRVLYEMFFEDYTRKVWGLHPVNIGKEWGEQRIKGLSLLKVVMDFFVKSKEVSLTDYYYYPKYGMGQMWNLMLDTILANGGELHLNSKIVKINKDNNEIVSVVDDKGCEYFGDYFVSSMPIKELFAGMNDVEPSVYDIATKLEYRDYQLIAYILDDFYLKNNTDYKTINNICPDSWIYVQDRSVRLGRIQIMNNWSPYMIKNLESDYVVGLEYFCNENDDLWNMTDDEIAQFGIKELEKLKVTDSSHVRAVKRFKEKKAYPTYFGAYKKFDEVKKYLNTITNLYPSGRNGQHKYNNMDHSLLSGLEAANCIINKTDKEILWKVNTEKSYQEAK